HRLQEDVGQRIERVANEFIKLHFFTRHCREHPILLTTLSPRIQAITERLQQQLEARLTLGLQACQQSLKKGVSNSAIESGTESGSLRLHVAPSSARLIGAPLRQALSTYLAIDKLPAAMIFYRQTAIRPILQ
ncbi:unnamed protein product, partial [Protopolystoma xenopodis]